MDILSLIRDMQAAPDKHITPVDPISLGAFLHGYMAANPAPWTAYDRLLERLRGPDAADAATRVYLLERDDEKAVSLLLSHLEELLAAEENRVVPEDAGTFEAWAPVVIEGIRQGRPGMFLGECTVMWLCNYVRGFHAGLHAADAAAARRQEGELEEFERWLQDRYDEPSAPWYKILRVFGGPGLRGLNKLVQTWDEWKSAKRGGTDVGGH